MPQSLPTPGDDQDAFQQLLRMSQVARRAGLLGDCPDEVILDCSRTMRQLLERAIAKNWNLIDSAKALDGVGEMDEEGLCDIEKLAQQPFSWARVAIEVKHLLRTWAQACSAGEEARALEAIESLRFLINEELGDAVDSLDSKPQITPAAGEGSNERASLVLTDRSGPPRGSGQTLLVETPDGAKAFTLNQVVVLKQWMRCGHHAREDKDKARSLRKRLRSLGLPTDPEGLKIV